jgi:predicted neuraminidase
MGARLPKRAGEWSAPFVLADTPGFPDCNPCLVIDPAQRLWLFWPVILDNRWESALLRCRRADDSASGDPVWSRDGVLLLKPDPRFGEVVRRDLEESWASRADAGYLRDRLTWSRDRLTVRLGWMPRAHPLLYGDRLILPLYSDRFDLSLVAYTRDGGESWECGEPIVGPACVQPALARRRDGALAAYFRDNGPPPGRIMTSESMDRGDTWSPVRRTDLPNPGSGVEALALRGGRWLLIFNDTERGRHSLAVAISRDEGRSWRTAAHLESDPPGPGAGSYSYPSAVQAQDGAIHVTYSHAAGGLETIRHARFTEDWLSLTEETTPDRA